MGRTLKFYLAAILVFGTAAFLVALFSIPDTRETSGDLLAGWAVISAMTGILLLVFYTPIQWFAYWLKRPWLAYLGSILLLPLVFLSDNFDYISDMDFSMELAMRILQRTWGLYLVAFLIGMLFTFAYQRWYRKKE